MPFTPRESLMNSTHIRRLFTPVLFAPLWMALLVTFCSPRLSLAYLISGTGGSQTAPVLALGVNINFDAGPTGNFNTITFNNVTFKGIDGPFLIGNPYINQYNTSGVNSLQTGNVLSPFLPSVWEFDFATPVNAFAFDFGASDDTWQMKAFDGANVQIDNQTFAPINGSSLGEYFGLVAPNMAKVLLIDLKDNYVGGDQVFIDDFRFTSEVVPEPTSGVLGGIGALTFVSVGLFHRRRGVATQMQVST